MCSFVHIVIVFKFLTGFHFFRFFFSSENGGGFAIAVVFRHKGEKKDVRVILIFRFQIIVTSLATIL